MRIVVLVAALSGLLLPPAVAAQVRPDTARAARDTVPLFFLEPIAVQGRSADLTGIATTASMGFVGRETLGRRPISREGEVLETIPGMILTQHSGGGKSNQMFVRGFNLDHGTDFATSLEEMPLNLPSHAHGHGYTDLNFLVPELVDHVEYALGPYYADMGDFGSAGGATIRLRRSLDTPLLKAERGENGHRRLAGAASTRVARGTLMVGGEVRGYDGPWVLPEDLQKRSGIARFSAARDHHSMSVLAMAYGNRWRPTDQVPLRAVRSGRISRFGTIDSTLVGQTSRYSLSGTWTHAGVGGTQQLSLYAARYDLDLYSNFTYRLEDQVAGDQIRQRDDGRWTWGGSFRHANELAFAGRLHRLQVGAEGRSDRARLLLLRSRERETVSVIREDRVLGLNGAAWTEVVTSWTTTFRTILGLRTDAFRFDVLSDRIENSGTRSAALVSPKASAVWGPWSGVEVYLSGGWGFHSNDARGTVVTVDPVTEAEAAAVDPLVRSRGVELGIRASLVGGFYSTLSLWTLDLDSELVFVGDAGGTEARDGSRRIGATWTAFYQIGPDVTADLDVSVTRARFLSGAPHARIPGAMENVVAGGISYDPEDGPFAVLRLRRLGAYPLQDSNAQRGDASALFNLAAGYRVGRGRITLSVLNLLDRDDADIQYFYTSRLRGEPAGGVADVHFHPTEPRQVRLSLSWGT